jgi:hypothetical protein
MQNYVSFHNEVLNIPHIRLNADISLNPINGPRHAILTQTSSINNPDRTFIAGYAKD